MPVLNKIDEATFNLAEPKVITAKNCVPSVQVLNGLKTEVTNDLGVIIPRGKYRTLVFVPDALLGEIRWNQVFGINTKRWGSYPTNKGVVFTFGRVNPM